VENIKTSTMHKMTCKVSERLSEFLAHRIPQSQSERSAPLECMHRRTIDLIRGETDF
jgi:hypothetical protein